MSKLIINSPVMSCCGMPRGECRCESTPAPKANVVPTGPGVFGARNHVVVNGEVDPYRPKPGRAMPRFSLTDFDDNGKLIR